MFFFFFFQAEDGIRDLTVTGVQTCALPILACAGDCNQMRRQIAAVDRRNIGRFERSQVARVVPVVEVAAESLQALHGDRKSTRLNSSHSQISYAVFCLKKKKKTKKI